LSYGGFEYDPRLIPSAQSYYYPQSPSPYAQQPYAQQPMYGGYQQPFPPEYEQQDPGYDALLETDQTPSTTGGAPTGGATPVPSDTAVVQTPDQTQDSTGTSSSPAPTTNSNMDPLDIQLAAALEAVKADMISKGKQVLEEKQWTDDVKAVIEQYTKKISNVYANIEKLKKDMGDLYKKKQQIINAQIQKSLTAKLKDSKSDLQTVQAALDKVTNTQMEFEQSKKDIQSTIDSIFAQLAELKGQPAPAPAAGETPAAGGAAGGAEAAAGGAAATPAAAADSAASSDSSDSSDTSDSDIADRTAEINSKIDTIKSIVTALNKGSSSSS
jgi:hypothetical protein